MKEVLVGFCFHILDQQNLSLSLISSCAGFELENHKNLSHCRFLKIQAGLIENLTKDINETDKIDIKFVKP